VRLIISGASRNRGRKLAGLCWSVAATPAALCAPQRSSVVSKKDKTNAGNDSHLLARILWNGPLRFAEPPITAFYVKSGSPKAVIALWNRWRSDRGYCGEWNRWREMEVAADDLKKWEDNEWLRWVRKPDSKEKCEALNKINESSQKRCEVVDGFLAAFANRFGIPPINPNSKAIGGDAQQAIRRWNVGKFNRAAWEISNDFEDEMSRHPERLRICVKVDADIGDIKKTVEAVVREWRERNKVKPARRVGAQEEKYDDYARAWYLKYVKGWTPSQIAHTLFGRGGKNSTKEAKRYAAAGAQLHKGTLHFIRGKKTLTPEREAQFKARMLAWLKRRRKVGGSKAET